MNILIADDDRNFTQLLSTFFKAKGHRVVIAYDALQALAAVMRTPPDVIILDVLMPGGSGLHALQRLKASTRTNRIPVAVVSASPDPQLPQTVKRFGADEFLLKPVSFEQLHETLVRMSQTAVPPPVSRERASHVSGAGPAGLRERAGILQVLQVELARAQRQGGSIGVVMVGLDHFQRISEVHGEEAGEMVRETANRLHLSLRAYDSLGQYEKGKLLVILPGCNGTAAMKKAEELRAVVREQVIKTGEGAILVTLSLGGSRQHGGESNQFELATSCRGRSTASSQQSWGRPHRTGLRIDDLRKTSRLDTPSVSLMRSNR